MHNVPLLEREYLYLDRHQHHSLNTFGVCGPQLTFYHISLMPGRTHDQSALEHSSLYEHFNAYYERLNRDDLGDYMPIRNGVILFDSGGVHVLLHGI